MTIRTWPAWALLLALSLCLAPSAAVHAGSMTNGFLSGFRLNLTEGEETNAPQYLLEMRKDPESAATVMFVLAVMDADTKLSKLQGEERKAKEAQWISMLREANGILNAGVRAHPGNTNLPIYRQMLQPSLAALLFETSTNHLAEVRSLAKEMLARNTNTSLPLFAVVGFMAHDLLGRVALRQDQPEEARACLRAAGKAPLEQLVGSFNADPGTRASLVSEFRSITLARELLERGGKENREAVLGFLDDLSRALAKQRSTAAQGFATNQLQLLEKWRREIRDGKIPSP